MNMKLSCNAPISIGDFRTVPHHDDSDAAGLSRSPEHSIDRALHKVSTRTVQEPLALRLRQMSAGVKRTSPGFPNVRFMTQSGHRALVQRAR